MPKIKLKIETEEKNSNDLKFGITNPIFIIFNMNSVIVQFIYVVIQDKIIYDYIICICMSLKLP